MSSYESNLVDALKWHVKNATDRHTKVLYALAAIRIMKLTKA